MPTDCWTTSWTSRKACPNCPSVGIQDYRQVFFKPYRLIYRLHGKQVVVYLIADGRRDMPALLARRLLGHSVR